VYFEGVSRFVTALTGVLTALLALSQPVNAGDPWHKLHRPLHLARVPPGAACPVSAVDQRVDWEGSNIFGGFGIGRGPVYPGLGPSGELVTTTTAYANGVPWFSGKVFWYVKPSYRGRVLIRGRRLDGPLSLRFNGVRRRELRIKPNQTVSWRGQPPGSRGVPSIVRARSSGCYGVQVDGTTFSRVVVFAVSTP
jgi:hypothetical protein